MLALGYHLAGTKTRILRMCLVSYGRSVCCPTVFTHCSSGRGHVAWRSRAAGCPIESMHPSERIFKHLHRIHYTLQCAASILRREIISDLYKTNAPRTSLSKHHSSPRQHLTSPQTYAVSFFWKTYFILFWKISIDWTQDFSTTFPVIFWHTQPFLFDSLGVFEDIDYICQFERYSFTLDRASIR